MKSLPLGLALLALGATAPSLPADLIDFLVGKRDIQVISHTEMTSAGRRLQAPTPQAPVYYIAVSKGFKNAGGAVGGEKNLPNNEAMQNIARVLAEQGYRPATAVTPAPTLLLVFTWGTLNVDETIMNFGDAENPDDSTATQLNREQILRFTGASKIGSLDRNADPFAPSSGQLGLTAAEAEKFEDLGSEDLYIAAVSAYDFEAAKARKKELLWITRISCPSSGFSLQGVMPTMLALAAPTIGRETTRPVWVNASDKYKTEIKIHDVQPLEYLEKGSATKPVPEKTK